MKADLSMKTDSGLVKFAPQLLQTDVPGGTNIFGFSKVSSVFIQSGNRTSKCYVLNPIQCGQIGRFSTLWATFQSRWQQLFCPN